MYQLELGQKAHISEVTEGREPQNREDGSLQLRDVVGGRTDPVSQGHSHRNLAMKIAPSPHLARCLPCPWLDRSAPLQQEPMRVLTVAYLPFHEGGWWTIDHDYQLEFRPLSGESTVNTGHMFPCNHRHTSSILGHAIDTYSAILWHRLMFGCPIL